MIGLGMSIPGGGGATPAGHVFVDRGDPATNDFDVGSFTQDSAWHDLDLSSIVPAGAVAVLLRLQFVDNTSGALLAFRKNGNTNAINTARIISRVASLWDVEDLWVACDANRVIEYMGNGTLTTINCTVGGWILPE